MNTFLLWFFAIYSLVIISDLIAEYQGCKDKQTDARTYFEKYGRKLKRKQ
jgi:hypothetical protein